MARHGNERPSPHLVDPSLRKRAGARRQVIGAGSSRADSLASANFCSRGRAGCEDGLGDSVPHTPGVIVAALTDAGYVKVRLVKVVGLPV